MNIPLSTFPAPLLRLILCGGKGLPPAWGPLADATGSLYSWHPYRGEVVVSGDYTTTDPMTGVGSWFFPLDGASPWPARLAMVAAWMLLPKPQRLILSGARCIGRIDETYLYAWLDNTGLISWGWDIGVGGVGVGMCSWSDMHPPRIQFKHLFPPAVALLLALYDVPEIRARVESA